MAKFVSIALIGFLASVALASPFDSRFDEQWEIFKKVYQKEYTASEERTRREIWENHVNEIIQHNFEYDFGTHTYSKGLNEYADMSHEEFKKVMNGFKGIKLQKANHTFVASSDIDLPDTVDWRNQGLVTAVKNQQQCGSCWAFSTTGSLEGQHMKRTGNLVSLSEQNLVDCSRAEDQFGNRPIQLINEATRFPNCSYVSSPDQKRCSAYTRDHYISTMGCQGGWMDEGFEYIKQNGGIDTEQSYPYTALDGTCQYNPQSVGATLTGFADVASGSETALQQAVATIGPVSVAIDASHASFQLYRGGIYNEPNCNPQSLDHAVLAVGYGTENGVEYWLVKNSWGTSWGDNGYIKMSRNRNNQCGIATRASYPMV